MKRCSVFVCISFILCLSILNSGCKQREDEYKVGVVIPLTGKGSVAGVNAQQAVNFCIDKWNEKGGVEGKKIVADFYDAKNSEPKEGAMTARKIVSSRQKPQVVMNVVSGVVMSAQPILDQNRIIQLSLSGSDNLFETSPKYTLRNYTSATQVSRKIIKELQPLFHTNKLKVLYPANEWGLSSMNSIREQAAINNVTVVHAESYNEDEISFRNYIIKCNLKDNDVLYVIGSQERIGRLVKQIRESNFNGVIIGGADIKTTSALTVIGDNKTNIYYTDIYKSPRIDELNEEFKKQYGTDIDEISLFFYNGLDLFLTYIAATGESDNDIVMQHINGYQYEGYMGKIEIENNEIIYPFEIKELE